MPETLDDLREHLQWAVELEHATLPPYLCALYTLDPERNPEAVEVVGSVFAEEMLHLTLAANLLNAVGGRPRLDTPENMKPFPRTLPHGNLKLSLEPFGPEALENFLRLEAPTPDGAPAQTEGYDTIGQFYAAIENGLRTLCARLGEEAVFTGDPSRQIGESHFRHTAGRLVPVTDLESALAALDEIVEQGEGMARDEVWDGDKDVFHPERDEVAHYYRFLELKAGRRYQRGDTPNSGPTGDPITVDPAGVYPITTTASSEEFNRAYRALLRALDEAFDGSPQLMGSAVAAMFGVKSQAMALIAKGALPAFVYVEAG
ncbi:ferritin-like domain-containing protein [Herbidospora cretacea]|uniref:ferritin-like domain-containing protein n=1 Tax=Herbidospora cretacea TaxID=28444 RepID=UPI00068DB51A|nr:ferritin-like protein [Herbidospora cretacea]